MSNSWSILTHPRRLLLLLTTGAAGIVVYSVMKHKKKQSPKPEMSSAPKNNVTSKPNEEEIEQKTVEVCETTNNQITDSSVVGESFEFDEKNVQKKQKNDEVFLNNHQQSSSVEPKIREIDSVANEDTASVVVTDQVDSGAIVENSIVVDAMVEPEKNHDKSWSDLMDEEEQEKLLVEADVLTDCKTIDISEKMSKLSVVEEEETQPATEETSSTSTRRDSGVGTPDEESTPVLLTTEDSNHVQEPAKSKSLNEEKITSVTTTNNSDNTVVERNVVSPASASSEESLKNHKMRTDSGCSYGGGVTSDDAHTTSSSTNGIGGNNNKHHPSSKMATNTSDSGNGSTEAEDNMKYAYHFSIPNTLCGKLIGFKGTNIRELRAATNCDLALVGANGRSSIAKNDAKKSAEPQTCILEGTRSAIERCLVLIREKFPLEQFPELTLDQTNLPNPEDVFRQQYEPCSTLELEIGQLTNISISAIISGGHICVQQPDHPTFEALVRLEFCMYQVYEQLKHQAPTVDREVIDVGLACIAKLEDKYYRLQITSYDITEDCCEVKFLDYGGFGTFLVSDLLQIRSDFLTLPFQAVECYLANVIPPNGSEWPFESAIHLEQLTNTSRQPQMRGNSCRMIGTAPDDLVPIVQLYTTTFNNDTGDLQTLLVNKELVERGGALWVEHPVVTA